MRELAEFLGHKRFTKDLLSSNGSNTAGVRMCEGRAIFYEDPKRSSGNVEELQLMRNV